MKTVKIGFSLSCEREKGRRRTKRMFNNMVSVPMFLFKLLRYYNIYHTGGEVATFS